MKKPIAKENINQMIIEAADKVYNNPQNLTEPLSEINSVTEALATALLHNVENLLTEVLYDMQEYLNKKN